MAERISELPKIFGEALYALIEQVETGEKEHVTLRFTLPSRDEACYYLLGIGTMVEVLEPLELRDMIATRAADVATLYKVATLNKS